MNKQNKLRQLYLLILLICITGGKNIAQVKLSEESWNLPTYQVEPANKNPIFFTNGRYQGASRVVYPYALNDVISDQRVYQDWKALVLENEYIKLCVAPEMGGKLYYAEDKTNKYNFIYKNDVVKPENLGMTGAWVSGGIEWCVVHHHRASTFLPVDYSLVENEDGSKTIFIGETEPRQSMSWTIGITLAPGKSYYEAEVKIYNPTPYTHSFLYWANVAAHTNDDYQIIFPPSVQFATYHAKNSFTHWPISHEIYNGRDFTEGVDVSWWKNNPLNNSFFAHDMKEDFMGGYDHGKNCGTVHVGDHNIVKGAKVWEWGSGPRGQATEGRLTENAGPYAEIMVGAFSDNQPDYSWIKPYEVKTFKQYWYPVRDIQGFKNANKNAAVNLEQRDKNQVFLGYYSTQKVSMAEVILKDGEKVILNKKVEISPELTFTELVKIDGPYQFTNLSTELIDLETGEVLISYQPVEKEYIEELPELVEAPPQPEKIPTVEELFLTGSRIAQFHNPGFNPLDYYQEALKRDPFDIRTNVALGKRFLKNGDYLSARSHFSRAISRLTKDYTRPSNCEALYLQGLTLKAMELYNEAIDTLYRATWDHAFHSAAYFELAQISCIKGDYSRAFHQIEESLSTNTKNTRAVALKACIQRHTGDYKGSLKTLKKIYQNDPLNFRIGNEIYLIAKESGNKEDAEKELNSLTEKMRDFNQNYLELADGYINDGMFDEAEDILNRFPGEDPIVSYYIGYVQDKKGNREQAGVQFTKAKEQSEDYCFPYRLTTIKVLETALNYNPEDGMAYYYLGNILFDKQPAKAIEKWENAVKHEPDLAIAYRNLGWGYYRHFEEVTKAIHNYEKAIALNKNEAIYYSELDALYELNNTEIDTRLALIDGNSEILRERDDAFVRMIKVYTLAGKPEKSVEYLQGKNFSYREGNSAVREMIIDAQLSLGIKYLEKGDNKKALEHFLEARVPEDEAGSARSGNREIQVNYFIGRVQEALGNKRKAKSFYELSAGVMQDQINLMSYYQGLSCLELGQKSRATEIFNSLVAEGERRLDPAENVDFFAKFGEKESESVLKSRAYTLRGLGHKGLGQKNLSNEDLSEAVKLSASNLWAGVELQK